MDSQPTMAKTVSRPHQYKCGVCSEEGHNSRNCPLRTTSNFNSGKSRMISPTKDAADVMGVAPHQQQQQGMQFLRQDPYMDGGLNNGSAMDARSRQAGPEGDAFASLGTLHGTFALAVTNTRRRVLQCAEHVANAATGVSPEEYNNAVAELVSAMDCLERVANCAKRFGSIVEGNVDGGDQDPKRRRK